MGADMIIASIAIPVEQSLPDFEKGRRALEGVTDPTSFSLDDYGEPGDIGLELIPGYDPEADPGDDGWPTLETLKRVGRIIVDALEEVISVYGREVTALDVAGYRLFLSGGPSYGDAPTEAAAAIWRIGVLPPDVRRAMGVVDKSRRLSRLDGSTGPLTDTDVVDAIALGLGTKSQWSGADELEWIAEVVGRVRPHPGNSDPRPYRAAFAAQRGGDPLRDLFLNTCVGEEALDDEEI